MVAWVDGNPRRHREADVEGMRDPDSKTGETIAMTAFASVHPFQVEIPPDSRSSAERVVETGTQIDGSAVQRGPIPLL